MKKSCLVAALAAAIAWMGWTCRPAAAQQTAPAAAPAYSGTRVALLDVNAVFKEHARFKEARKQFEESVRSEELQWKKEEEGIRKQAEQARGQYNPGTAEYKQADEKIMRLQMDFQARVTMRKKEVIQQEAMMYFNVYREILYQVEDISRQYGISLVINFNRAQVNPSTPPPPDDIMRLLNRQVLWNTTNLDITPEVVRRLNPPPSANRDPFRR